MSGGINKGVAHEDGNLMSSERIRDPNVLIAFQPIERLASATQQDLIHLEPYAVHLWGIELDGPPLCLERCAGWLNEAERQRAARFVRTDLQRLYMLAHGGLRAVLSRYLGVAPNHVAIYRTATGKPFLTKDRQDHPTITFNLSHAHGRALIAVSNGQEVGIDLESVRSEVNASALSERYFSSSEHTAIMQLTQTQRAKRFFRYWVAKEALLKAQGIGLRGLSGCEIFFETDGANPDIHARLGAHFTNPLQVRLLRCETGWEAAVAAPNLDRVKQYGSLME